ncbi:MAG: glutaredoxin family protein, partial [Acidobacteria bacterium]|nr:glutaredoxin family protein [Acidobacteriota bacterium]
MLTLTEERPSLAIKNYKKEGLAWLHLYSFHISVARRIFCNTAGINQTGAKLSDTFCPPDMPTQAKVIIYTRPGCHLCEEAKRTIAAA